MFEIIKHSANRWEVAGRFIIGSRGKTESYCRIFTSKKAATADAVKMECAEIETAKDVAEIQAARVTYVAEYLAERIARNAYKADQMLFAI